MEDLPAKAPDLSNLPAPLAESLGQGTPMQQVFGMVLQELGGIDFMVDWAEEAPGEFIRLLVAQSGPVGVPTAGGGGTHIHLHPALSQGPLDIEGEVVGKS
jgi:hypothetical protein